MQINLNKKQILEYAQGYDDAKYPDLSPRLKPAAERGFLNREELVEVARWKWKGGRTRNLVMENSEAEVKEISGASFGAKSERLRIGALLALRGVSWPMASVILHFTFPNKYPIIDRRTMKAVGGSTSYNFNCWMEYMQLCQRKSNEYGICMRELDQGLFEYGREA